MAAVFHPPPRPTPEPCLAQHETDSSKQESLPSPSLERENSVAKFTSLALNQHALRINTKPAPTTVLPLPAAKLMGRLPRPEFAAHSQGVSQLGSPEIRYPPNHQAAANGPARSVLQPLPRRSTLVQRATHPDPGSGQHMGINLRRGHVIVPQQLLNGSNIRARLQQMRREGMP